MMKITVINGPNLNLLGVREKGIYGDQSFEQFFTKLQQEFRDITFSYFQSNIEGELIDKLHEIGFEDQGIILNAGGYTHTSVALTDAVAAIKAPVVEVHISNIYSREDYRHKSLLSKNCQGIISGFGLDGYKLAVHYLTRRR